MKELINIIKTSLITAIVGLFAGFLLGLLIWWMSGIVSIADFSRAPSREFIAFLGMSFGAMLGAVFGGIVGMKER